MLADGTIYSVELVCDYPDWWRFNIYMVVVGFDREGNSISFNNYTDRIYDLDYSRGRTAPEGFVPVLRRALAQSEPCHHIELYLYAVTNTFPDSEAIKDSPPFEATLRVSAGGNVISSENYDVNQWGGLTIVGKKFGPAEE